MTYTVLARRYRSRTFDQLVGQRAIAETLERAVEQDRVAHAYLFCGTRGVGKTSLARILARSLNAVDELTDAQAVAEAIMRGEDLDVIEIDGASNRGVEQARELISAAGLSPARCPYRIYIIDEVHMLTSEAFNTLLKTMEEPPAHVKFLLCTTEPHKVPPTIRSRCQRFDFRPITRTDIAAHLGHVLEQEGVQAEDGVLDRVATMGRGSMRDALSVLERLLATGASSVSMEHVEGTLGLPPTELVLMLTDAVLLGDAAGALETAEALLQQGIALDQVIDSLIDTWRSLMLLATCGEDTPLIDCIDAQRAELVQRASSAGPDIFAHGVAVLEAVARQASLAASARALFDAALVRLSLGCALDDDAADPGAIRKRSTSKKKVMPRRAASAEPPAPDPTPAPAPAPEPTPSSKATAAHASSADECWRGIVSSMDSRGLQAAAEFLDPVSMAEGVLTLRAQGAPSGVLNDRLDAMRAVASKAGVTLNVEASSAVVADAPVAADPDTAGDPVVRMVSEVFDARVVKIRPVDAELPAPHAKE